MEEESLVFRGRRKGLEGRKLMRTMMQHGELSRLHLTLLSRRQYDVTLHGRLVNLNRRKYRQQVV
jgi:hypothetical protein